MAAVHKQWATYLGKAEKEIEFVDNELMLADTAAQFLGIDKRDAHAMIGDLPI